MAWYEWRPFGLEAHASMGGGDKGGPWGAGPKRPWGSEPSRGGGGTNGPDLEDWLRDLRARFRGPGGGGGGPSGPMPRGVGWPLLVGVLIVGWIASGIYIVDEGERAVIQRFGRYDRTEAPGMRMQMPWPIEARTVVPFTNQQIMEIGYRGAEDVPEESLMITGDRNIVDIRFRVLYRASNAYDYVFHIDNQLDTIRGVAESAMREVIGQRQLQDIITRNRAEVETAVQALMQSVLDSYEAGVQVSQVQLQRAQAPQQVADAFYDVVRAGQDAEGAQNEARRYLNEQVPLARGQAAQIVQDAPAYRERVIREANGEASRFDPVYSQYRLAPRVTRDRIYLETMERIYQRADTVILDQRAGAVPYLPLDGMRRGNGPIVTAPAPAQPAAPQRQGGQ